MWNYVAIKLCKKQGKRSKTQNENVGYGMWVEEFAGEAEDKGRRQRAGGGIMVT